MTNTQTVLAQERLPRTFHAKERTCNKKAHETAWCIQSYVLERAKKGKKKNEQ
jgi:hypothetical protein